MKVVLSRRPNKWYRA